MRSKLSLLVVSLCALLGCKPVEKPVTTLKVPVPTSSSAAQPTESDWPGFRGAAKQGQFASESLPVEWGQREGVVWSVSVPPGRSSPVICRDQLFLTSEVQQGEAGECHLHCFDRATGASQWTTKLGVASGSTHRRNGFASATPVTDGQYVITSLPPLGIFCHDLQGKLLWQQSLGSVSQKWGFASSPIVYEGMVIQLCDSEADSYLTAFTIATGEIVWQQPRESQGCWATPVIAPVGETDLLVINGTGSTDGSPGYVIAYDPYTGSEVWRVKGTTDIPCPTAIVADDLIVSSSGGNGSIFALRPDISLALEERVVWRHAAGGPYVPTGIAYEGLLYIVTDGGMLSCYRVATGERLYRRRLNGTFSASLLAGAGKIYITSERGDVYVIRAGEEYALVSTNRMHSHCWATPAIAYDSIYIRTDSELYCVGGIDQSTEESTVTPPAKPIPSPSDTSQDDA